MSMRTATHSVHDTNVCYKPSTCKRRLYRSTQIIATIGLKMEKPQMISMISTGMNIACFDAKEGKSGLDDVSKLVVKFREALKEYNEKRSTELAEQLKKNKECDAKDYKNMEIHIATALDLKSVYIETGIFKEETKFSLEKPVSLTNDINFKDSSDSEKVYIDFADLPNVPKEKLIFINQCIICEVLGKDTANEKTTLLCKIVQEGIVGSNNEKLGNFVNKTAEVNIPGYATNLGGVADDLQAMTTFCRKNDITMMFIPIENPQSMKSIKCVVNPEGVDKKIKVIAKVEGMDAVNNVDQIIEKADGVFIGRKRLGRNVAMEQVTAYQKIIVAKCLKAGIPSIIAKHVMGKLGYDQCGPSRAETADVFNAVLDGADCVMLGEKNSGLDAITNLKLTIMEAEDMTNFRRLNRDLMSQVNVPCAPVHCGYFTDSLAIAATTCAMVNGASVIIVLTDNGRAVKYLSKYRPECPILVVTKTPSMAEQCLLHRGVFSIVSDEFPANYDKNVEEKIKSGIMFARSCFLIKKLPACVVVVYATKDNAEKSDTLRIIYVDREKKLETEEKCFGDI